MFQVSTTSFHTTRSLFRKLSMALLNRTAHLHTRQCWLKTELLPTAVNSLLKMNGLRTHLTSALWTTMSGDYAWMVQVSSTQAGEHRWAQESSAVDMGPAATGLDQQSHIELPEKTSGCVKAGGGHLEHMLKWTTCQILIFVITVNVSWQWKLQVSVDYSVQNWTYGIEYLYRHNFGEIWSFNFKKIRIVAGSLPYNSRNLSIKISHGCQEIAFCPVGYFNLSHPVELQSYVTT